MAHDTPVGAPKDFTLQQLNALIAQQEDILGPLTKIGHDASQTILTFDTDPPSPAKHAVLAADQGGAANVPVGSSQVCRGQVFVSGALQACTASRPS